MQISDSNFVQHSHGSDKAEKGLTLLSVIVMGYHEPLETSKWKTMK